MRETSKSCLAIVSTYQGYFGTKPASIPSAVELFFVCPKGIAYFPGISRQGSSLADSVVVAAGRMPPIVRVAFGMAEVDEEQRLSCMLIRAMRTWGARGVLFGPSCVLVPAFAGFAGGPKRAHSFRT